MQKRINDLNKKLEPIIDRMRGYPAFDTQGYNELKDQRLYLQNEIDWLTEIQRNLHLPIESDSYNEQFHQIGIRLTIAPQTVISPLNKWVFAMDDARAAKMHVINVDRIRYEFQYSGEIVGEYPPQRIADQITLSYIRAAKPLDDMLQGVKYANIALQYFSMMQRTGFGYPTVDKNLEYAANLAHVILRYEGEDIEIVDEATKDDGYLNRLKESADEYWPTACKLIAFTLREGRYNIDWQPFGMGLATSR